VLSSSRSDGALASASQCSSRNQELSRRCRLVFSRGRDRRSSPYNPRLPCISAIFFLFMPANRTSSVFSLPHFSRFINTRRYSDNPQTAVAIRKGGLNNKPLMVRVQRRCEVIYFRHSTIRAAPSRDRGKCFSAFITRPQVFFLQPPPSTSSSPLFPHLSPKLPHQDIARLWASSLMCVRWLALMDGAS
jgi:hypothetical protein